MLVTAKLLFFYIKGWLPAADFKVLHWSSPDSFDGIPFTYVTDGRLNLQFHQGVDQNKQLNKRMV